MYLRIERPVMILGSVVTCYVRRTSALVANVRVCILSSVLNPPTC